MKRLILVFTAVLVFVLVVSFNTAMAGDKPKVVQVNTKVHRPTFVQSKIKCFVKPDYLSLLGWGTANFKDTSASMDVSWVAWRNSDGLVTIDFSLELNSFWLEDLRQIKDTLNRPWAAGAKWVETSNEPYLSSNDWDSQRRSAMEWAIARFKKMKWCRSMEIKEILGPPNW